MKKAKDKIVKAYTAKDKFELLVYKNHWTWRVKGKAKKKSC